MLSHSFAYRWHQSYMTVSHSCSLLMLYVSSNRELSRHDIECVQYNLF